MFFVGGAYDGRDDSGYNIQGNTVRLVIPYDLPPSISIGEEPSLSPTITTADYARQAFFRNQSDAGKRDVRYFWLWEKLSKAEAEDLISKRYFEGHTVSMAG